LLLVWLHATARFFVPVAPLLFALLLSGAAYLADRWRPGRRPWIVALVTGAVAIGALRRDAAQLGAMRGCDRDAPAESPTCFPEGDREALRLARWARDSTAPADLFFTSKERAFYFHAGRRSINQDRALREGPATLAPYLRAHGVRYVVVSPVGVWAKQHNALVAAACDQFAVVHRESDRSMILRLRPVGERGEDGAACRALAPVRR
ncbi:MAG TPA: hypothetical protein VFV33_23475, partial [Gemmatimonadaceae bacterium]|nr:hypothetical protein [Gemmatimonadaceae bacterium]